MFYLLKECVQLKFTTINIKPAIKHIHSIVSFEVPYDIYPTFIYNEYKSWINIVYYTYIY